MAEPAASVVVCTRGRPDLLEGCLRALENQDHPSYEVIVVDNAPLDERTRTVVARHPGVRYELEPVVGLNRARNRGLACASGAFVAFTDDDARPAPDWLRLIGERFAVSTDVAGVTGLVEPAELETESQLIFERSYRGMSKGPLQQLHRRTRRNAYLPARFGTGCNMAFRRRALARAGGFDPALDVGTLSGGGGDLDMLQRFYEDGCAIDYSPSVVVRHVHRRTMGELRQQLFDNGRGYSAAMTAAFIRARRSARLVVLLWWFLWLGWWFGRRIVLRLVRRHAMPLRLVLVELAGALAGPALYLLARRRAERGATRRSAPAPLRGPAAAPPRAARTRP